MPKAGSDKPEWIDGFLFVGNHPSLDLLNTRLVNADGPVELLPDTGSLARWLHAAGILRDPPAIAAVNAWRDSRSAQKFLRNLHVFREQLRAAVVQFRSGEVADLFLQELNAKLLIYPRRYILKRDGSAIERKTFLEVKKPEELWSEIAGSASDLFTDVSTSRLRRCEGCVVHFQDTSKKGSRRWCSMNLCGNREKVAAFRQKRNAVGI